MFNVTLWTVHFCHLSEEENYLGKSNSFRNTFFCHWDWVFCLAVNVSSPYKWKQQYWRAGDRIEPKNNLRLNGRANGKVSLMLFLLTTDPAVLLLLFESSVGYQGQESLSISPAGDALSEKLAAVAFSPPKSPSFYLSYSYLTALLYMSAFRIMARMILLAIWLPFSLAQSVVRWLMIA